jgi:RND family efflux transporter MFP subunit
MTSSNSGSITADRDESKVTPDASPGSRYRFRADLEIVRDGGPDISGSDVTVIDAQSGQRHVFTADELCLCRAADGTRTLAAIRQAFKAETGREISHGKLFAFFRQLRSLGLFEESATNEPEPVAPIVENIPKVSEPRSGEGGGQPVPSSGSRYRFRADLEIARDGPDVAVSDVTVIDARSDQRHVFTADEFRLCRAADGSNTLAAIRQAFKAKTGREISHGKLFAFFRRLRSLGLLEEDAANESERAASIAVNSPQRTESRSGENEGQPAAQDESIATVARARVGDAGTHGAGDLEAAFGGGMGESRPMLSGGLEGRGLGRGGAQNFLAILEARARAARQDAETAGAADANEPARITLFDPNVILGILATLTRPLKYIALPLLLIVPAAIWIVYQHRGLLAENIRAFDASVVGTAILGLVITGLACRVTQGTFLRGFGVEVKQFGIALMFGIPRFYVDLGGIAKLGRRGQLWVYAAPLIARLGLFSIGTLLWFVLRQSAPSLSHLTLVVGQIGLLAFLLSVMPLLPSDGYRWLATYFGRPALRAEALRGMIGSRPGFGRLALRSGALRGRSVSPAGLRRPALRSEALDNMSGLSATTLYVIAAALAVLVLALVVEVYFDIATTGDVRLLTAVLLLGFGVALVAWMTALRNYTRNCKIKVLNSAATQQVLANGTGAADVASDLPVSVGTVGKVFWAVVLCALLAVAFLPYRYEVAGKFEILPAQRTVVAVRTSGEVERVLVGEGDWVKTDQVLAKLSSDDQQREVSITSAELERAKTQLAQFDGETTTSPEAALNQSLDSASSKKDPTATNYFRTQAERAARAEVERLTRKLEYERDQLAQTDVRAPKEGRVMTPNVRFLTGTWLRRGAELLSLDDTRTLKAEINLPEADIGLVKVGDKVRLRPWSNEDREIGGTLTEIAPAAQARPNGMIVRVGASIPNHDAFLLPAMTGYAKIDGEDMRVWEAFLRRTIRIVRVEMWSWIP